MGRCGREGDTVHLGAKGSTVSSSIIEAWGEAYPLATSVHYHNV